VGKWHLGDAPEFLPRQHGFDLYRGVPYSHDMFIRRGEQLGMPFMDGDEIIEHPTNLNTLTERFTEDAVGFIHANKNNPFLLFFSHVMPHVPLSLPAHARGSRGGRYGDAVEHIDWSVGQVLDAVARNGLERDTLILFTSDNGPWLDRRPNAGTAEPLRGGKTTTWEGGVRVPCVVRWTGQTPSGKDCAAVATVMDIVPTLAAINGVSLPANAPIDGHDLLPLLRRPADAVSAYDAYFYYSHRPGPVAGVRQGRFKFVGNDQTATPELYDLVEDIGETTNVADSHPEVVAQLRQVIAAHRAQMDQVRRPPARSSRPRVGNKPDRGANDR
jgi:arylsulfatase A-like enzyme